MTSTVEIHETQVARKRKAGGHRTREAHAPSAASTNSVARKGRTSASYSPKTSDIARSSKQSRASGAGGQRDSDAHGTNAASKISKGRKPRTAASIIAPTTGAAPQSTNKPRAIVDAKTKLTPRAATLSDGHISCEDQLPSAVATLSALQHTPDTHTNGERAPNTGGHHPFATHNANAASYPMPSAQRAPIGEINDAWRKRQGIVRAMTKLSLQAQATLRSGRDREEAAKHYAVVAKDPMHADYPIIVPYLEALQPLARHRGDYEKGLVKLVKQLPIYGWAKGVSGLGEVSLAGLVGECSGFNMETDEIWSIGQMKSVSALWKRMGVAVVGGIRQQRVKGDAAIEHGYVADRRAVLWNIGECIVKAQWRKENTVHAHGKLYGEIKAAMQERNAAGYYAESALAITERMKKAGSKPNPENAAGRLTPMHINNRAKRHVTKRLLRDLFVEWRRLDAEARGIHSAEKI